MITELSKLHNEFYTEVEAISLKYDCKIRKKQFKDVECITECYGQRISEYQFKMADHSWNNTCCNKCPNLDQVKGCVTKNLSCKIYFCMPMLKKIQKKNFDDFMVLTAYKAVFCEGHYFSRKSEIYTWIFRRMYFDGLKNEYLSRETTNSHEQFILDKTVAICTKLLEAIENTVNKYGFIKITMEMEKILIKEGEKHSTNVI